MVLLSSCKSTFFQVYKTNSDGVLEANSNVLVFENNDCKVVYNLWEEGGNVGFKLFNKTNENIYLDLGESFFILNGEAFDYYKEREYSEKITTGLNKHKSDRVFALTAQDKSVTFHEIRVVCVPAECSKVINEYHVATKRYYSCDLNLYPMNASKVKVVKFTRDNSPYVFSNRITYKVGEHNAVKRINHEFYVSEISNHPYTDITYWQDRDFCGRNLKTRILMMKKGIPTEFYIQYKRTNEKY